VRRVRAAGLAKSRISGRRTRSRTPENVLGGAGSSPDQPMEADMTSNNQAAIEQQAHA